MNNFQMEVEVPLGDNTITLVGECEPDGHDMYVDLHDVKLGGESIYELLHSVLTYNRPKPEASVAWNKFEKHLADLLGEKAGDSYESELMARAEYLWELRNDR